MIEVFFDKNYRRAQPRSPLLVVTRKAALYYAPPAQQEVATWLAAQRHTRTNSWGNFLHAHVIKPFRPLAALARGNDLEFRLRTSVNQNRAHFYSQLLKTGPRPSRKSLENFEVWLGATQKELARLQPKALMLAQCAPGKFLKEIYRKAQAHDKDVFKLLATKPELLEYYSAPGKGRDFGLLRHQSLELKQAVASARLILTLHKHFNQHAVPGENFLRSASVSATGVTRPAAPNFTPILPEIGGYAPKGLFVVPEPLKLTRGDLTVRWRHCAAVAGPGPAGAYCYWIKDTDSIKPRRKNSN